MTAMKRLVQAAENLLNDLNLYRVPHCERDRSDLRLIIAAVKTELAATTTDSDDIVQDAENECVLAAVRAAGITKPGHLQELFEAIEAAKDLLKHREALDLYVYLDALQDALAAVEAEQHYDWEEMAKQYARNCEYYRNLVVEIGKMIGTAAYISDDGSVQQDVLCAKVPELVARMLKAYKNAGVTHPEHLQELFEAIDAPPLTIGHEYKRRTSRIKNLADKCRAKGGE